MRHVTTPGPGDIEHALEGAALWGAELDTRYRVLAATIEPDEAGASSLGIEHAADLRLQMLIHPVSVVLAVLLRTDQEPAQLLTFEADNLIGVTTAFGGRPLETPLFGRPEPTPGSWAPQWSLEGRSSAPDGRANTLTLEVADDRAHLRLFARFDDLTLRSADGATLLDTTG